MLSLKEEKERKMANKPELNKNIQNIDAQGPEKKEQIKTYGCILTSEGKAIADVILKKINESEKRLEDHVSEEIGEVKKNISLIMNKLDIPEEQIEEY